MRARALLPALAAALTACAPAAPPAGPAVPTGFGADSAATRQVAPGVLHHALRYGAGPWAVHVLEVAPEACGVELRAAKGERRLTGRRPTSRLAAEAEAALGRPVLGAVNADFFTFRPDGVPVGPQVSAGEVLKDAGAIPDTTLDRRRARLAAFGVAVDGTPVFLEHAALAGALRARGGDLAPVGGVNTRARGDSLLLLNGFLGDTTPADPSLVEVAVRVLRAAPAGDTLRGVVQRLDTLPAGVAPGDGVVFAGRGAAGAWLRQRMAPGDTVSWWTGFAGAPGPVRELVGGFPMLLRAGRSLLAETPGLAASFAETRHPRTAVGLRSDGTLLLVVVDGRQPGYSEGMSLEELTGLLRRLGASDAINLDGGGSTAMVVRGALVNRPSDREGERPVANALLVLGPTPGRCPAAPR